MKLLEVHYLDFNDFYANKPVNNKSDYLESTYVSRRNERDLT